MITNILKVALLSIGATSNVVLPHQNKYITDNEPTYDSTVYLYCDTDFSVYTEDMLHEGTLWDDPYTTTQYSTAVCEKTTNSLKTKTIFLTAFQYEQEHDNEDLWLIDTVARKPFYLAITSFEIQGNSNLAFNITNCNTRVFGGTDSQLWNATMLIAYHSYICLDKDLNNYMQTLWDYFDKNRNSITASDPYVYKDNLITAIENVSVSHSYTETKVVREGTFCENLSYNVQTSEYDKIGITNGQKAYLLQYMSMERLDKNIKIKITDPDLPILDIEYNSGEQYNLSYDYEGWIITPVNYEVIDVPGLMFTVISMPFTFFSKAFNLTLFPNTPYTINIGNILLSIIAMLSFIIILKLILKVKG